MKVWAEPTDRHRGFFAGMSLTIFALCHQFCLLCSISLYLFFSPCCFPPFSLAPCKCHIVSVAISLLSFPGLAARAAPGRGECGENAGITVYPQEKSRIQFHSKSHNPRKEACRLQWPFIPLCTAMQNLERTVGFC